MVPYIIFIYYKKKDQHSELGGSFSSQDSSSHNTHLIHDRVYLETVCKV